MNGLPLNINWQQVLLHLLNFFILALGLYWLIYEPVVRFIEKRQKHFSDLEEAAAAKLKEAETKLSQVEEEYQGKRSEWEEQRSMLIEKAHQEADRKLEAAEKQSRDMLRNARAMAEREQTRMREEANRELKTLLRESSEKLLYEDIDRSVEAFLAQSGKLAGKQESDV